MVDNGAAHAPASGVLAQLTDLLRRLPADGGGALWRLDRTGRQLDANLVRLAPGAEVGAWVEPDLDVLLYVTEGSGRLESDSGQETLRAGAVVWLGHGGRRALSAGEQGLMYLSVHRRRPGLTIGRPGGEGGGAREAGEAACLLDRVCDACGRLATESDARFCYRCGEPLPEH
ncbi:hypothetical protein [Streptomyces reniochalinae]|uniref:Uncharacterized protein n=1 Tax=Streptomyces reniochalinae TaxID=2250578 RepID=A0A367EHA5_9ACTN|nr:hypothetical protein [Streptomyces reniochalinae]RCG17444.1 hypothetical protein DQ392_16285 [Streptomyces reniochalinae]